ncbi:MAG TPA: DUF4350 domain-containing protein [Candidatus Binataceae bacterium]|nr:DUF4350 domain-containing protein [Candidatus Binataceae bacterium]
MIRLPKSFLFSAALLALMLLALNLWLQRNTFIERSSTSLGTGPSGYKGAFELLQELDFTVARSYQLTQQVPPTKTLWFIAPDFLSESAPGFQADVDDLTSWFEAGGVAVVTGDGASDWKRLNLDEKLAVGSRTTIVAGAMLPRSRVLATGGLLHFKHAGQGNSVLLTADGEPFAIEVKVGAGRLIAIADGGFLLNSNIADSDASLLLVDLARHFGPPVFDEHAHGLAEPSSPAALLLHPRLAAAIVFILMTAILWILEQRSIPPRTLADDDSVAPSLDTFVDSLAELYRRARDPRAAYRAYRSNFLRRARQRLSRGLEVSEPAAIKRILRDKTLPDDARHWLTSTELPSTEASFVRAVRALESCSGPTHEQRQA